MGNSGVLHCMKLARSLTPTIERAIQITIGRNQKRRKEAEQTTGNKMQLRIVSDDSRPCRQPRLASASGGMPLTRPAAV